MVPRIIRILITVGRKGATSVLPLYQRFPRGSPLYLQYPCGFTAVHYGNPVPLALPKAFHCVCHGLHSGKPRNSSIHQCLRSHWYNLFRGGLYGASIGHLGHTRVSTGSTGSPQAPLGTAGHGGVRVVAPEGGTPGHFRIKNHLVVPSVSPQSHGSSHAHCPQCPT